VPDRVSDLARRLAENAEAVCRHYLPNGRRQGGYWLAGDVRNTPGRSLYVRLRGPSSGRGAAGKWADSATGEHGDLLDLIGAARELRTLGDTLDEARRFFGLVRPKPRPFSPAPAGSPDAAQRLFAMSTPVAGTLAETYLRTRGIEQRADLTALRFHPRCYYRADPGSQDGARKTWPALIAAVTDQDGQITGLQRTYLAPGLRPSDTGKAPVATPRRAMGHLLGHAVRFGVARDALAVGEGLETVLSLRNALPFLPLAAALSAGHLAALLFPPGLRRLYVVLDRDPAGKAAADRLVNRAQAAGIEALVLAPTLGDWNDDLRQRGPDALAASVRVQLAPEDVARFWQSPERGRRAC
jgi:phage/plasmid primase-like uncharacterized protein